MGETRGMGRRLLALLGLVLSLVAVAPAAADDPSDEKAAVDARIASLQADISASKAREGVLTSQLSAVVAELEDAQSAVDDAEAAVKHGLQLLEEGADVLDVGGESTRPGSDAVDELEEELATHTVSPAARASAEKGITELRDALGPDAYWKAPTWKRLVAIGAGPAANILLTIVLFTILFMTVAGEATRTIETVAPELRAGQTSPAQSVGLRAGDTIVAINGKPVRADEIAQTIAAAGIPVVLKDVANELVQAGLDEAVADGRTEAARVDSFRRLLASREQPLD